MAILDKRMPGMDGLALARAIKADPALADLSLLLLTSVDGAVDGAVDGEDSRLFAAALQKPVRQSYLRNALLELLGMECAAPARTEPVKSMETRFDARLLLVEDNPINAEVTHGLLESFGCRVDTVADGQAAIDAWQLADYALILMDCQMPGMDGFEATRHIRAIKAERGSGARQPIVALTANALTEDRRACLIAGMDDHLGKPVTRDDIHRMLIKHLRSEAANGHGHPDEAAGPAAEVPRHATVDTATYASGIDAGKTGWATVPATEDLLRGEWESGSLCVLLAEDDPIIQSVTTGFLRHLGHRVSTVRNGRQAIEAVERDGFDLVLMDLCMPKVSGFAATAAIRTRRDAKAHIPIIALTGNTSAYDQETCRAAGMDGYIAKPVTLEALSEALYGFARSGHRTKNAPNPAPSASGRIIAGQLETLRGVLGEAKVRHLLNIYATSARASVTRMAAFMKAGDAAEVHAASHDLKSTSGNLGFRIVADLARAIDEGARAGDLERGHQLLPRLSSELDAALSEVLSGGDNPRDQAAPARSIQPMETEASAT